MKRFKLNQLLKKKCIVLTFLIVCSLLISEKALAVYNKNCCGVYGIYKSKRERNHIKIFFKFFEYEKKHGIENSYLNHFEVEYSTDSGIKYTHLMSASTWNQTSKDRAWIYLVDKKDGSKIDIIMTPRYQRIESSSRWKNGTHPRLEVSNDPISGNEAWVGVVWYHAKEYLFKVTNIQIKAKWYNHELMKTEDVLLDYDVTPEKAKMNSNSLRFFNSSAKQEIRTEDAIKPVKAYKEANSIVIKGALSEKIQVYTSIGALVKSAVADCDVLQIPVTANQLYIVNVGQARYKVAL